jgi:hypothetical protein
MYRSMMTILLGSLLVAVLSGGLPAGAMAAESRGQERMAYLELTRLRSLSAPGVSYPEYREAVVRAQGQMGLLRDASSGVVKWLRNAMAYYDQALAVWRVQAEGDPPADSLRTDEADGAAIVVQCPDIPTFHLKSRDRIMVQDAVACLWRKAATVLDEAPAELH